MQEATSAPLLSSAFDDYNQKLQTAGLTSTRKAAGLPSDVAFHRSMDHELADGLDAFSERVLAMTNKLLALVSTVDLTPTSRGKAKAKLEGQDDVVDHFHNIVVDSVDQLLEKTDICLDEFLGKNKPPAIAINPPITSNNKKSTSKATTEKGRIEPIIQHAAHLAKPQLQFTKMPDNSDAPWYPSLSHKYNAKVPLGHVYTDEGIENISGVIANHPYRYEITHLSHPPRMFEPCTPVLPPSLEDTEATWIDTAEGFQQMLAKLKRAKEIAVDLEHHSYRSYAGFLCLMQISDRDEDWVVDLLAMRDEMETLNEVFTDPEIIKVFHGADSDIVWLQQDFNLYIVNLFDTFHASKLLEFPRHGLANLLEMYCDFIPDKRYQLADWRIRPLPNDMLKYARSDTHFLLYIYDNLRNALLDRSRSQAPSRSPSPASSSHSTPARELLYQSLERSAETSLRVYSKDPYDSAEGSGSTGWDTLAKKWNKGALMAGGPGVGVDALQREVYKSVHGWRERVAREEDESTRYVMQNHVLFTIAEQPPADMAALLAIFRSSVPSVVKKRAKELLGVIREAVKRGLGPSRGETRLDEDQNGSKEGEQMKIQQASRDVVMLDTEIKNLEQINVVESTNIWGRSMKQAASSTPHSLLLGVSQSSMKGPITNTLATSVSALFGNNGSKILASNSNIKTVNAATGQSREHVKDLVAKINRSFVMASTAPKAVSTTREPAVSEVVANEKVDEVTGMQVEIPYVPAAQRSTKRVEEVERDTIVTVGLARQKRKRKAGEVKEQDVESASPDDGAMLDVKAKVKKEGDGLESGAIEPFDFAAVPNILDDNPDTEDRKKKRQRKTIKGGNFYGDFPAPPKAHSELKSGNQSHTFK
ncbi:hypothetical protein BDN70DRAFT_865980 [Pholiota conissans]|uniref:HRDC domain-containing protein n=1 Tax=Pholiota conissans TaxID=109636 RepID=A0A9P5YRL1_9AGAR|nr:hypothetical protein BDN70DRAFT_865980 [Pholiota conissans]